MLLKTQREMHIAQCTVHCMIEGASHFANQIFDGDIYSAHIINYYENDTIAINSSFFIKGPLHGWPMWKSPDQMRDAVRPRHKERAGYVLQRQHSWYGGA